MGVKGWICPVCGRGLAPSTVACPCVTETKVEIKKPIAPIPDDVWEKYKKARIEYRGTYNPCDNCPNKNKGPCCCSLPDLYKTTWAVFI